MKKPWTAHNEALKLSRRFAPRSLTPVRYTPQLIRREWRLLFVSQAGGEAVRLEERGVQLGA
jgi:hypothetical protein